MHQVPIFLFLATWLLLCPRVLKTVIALYAALVIYRVIRSRQ